MYQNLKTKKKEKKQPMSEMFLEKNRQAILDELVTNMNTLSDITSTNLTQTHIELEEPIHPKLLDVYSSLFSVTGHMVALFSELMVLERGEIEEEQKKPIGFNAMGGD